MANKKKVIVHSPEFKAEALKPSEKVGVAATAIQISLHESQIYGWRKAVKKDIVTSQREQELNTKVKDTFDDSKGRDGSRGNQKELAKNGDSNNVKTISASMKRQGLTPKSARKFKCITDSKHKIPAAPNSLDQDFNATTPNEKWVGDITYVATSEGWLYLAVIIDLYSDNSRMTATLVYDALSMALVRRGLPEQVIVHGDRDSQYCSKDYRGLITAYNLQQSMS